MKLPYDLLLTNGLLVDPSQNINRPMDVAIEGDRIALLAPHVDSSQAKRVINVTGKLITPGLIDAHVHCFHNMREVCVSTHKAGVYSGVTTVVDAGDAGPGLLMGFRKFIAEPAQCHVYCFLNVASGGMMNNPTPGLKGQTNLYELNHWSDMNREFILDRVMANRDLVLGIKIRAFGTLINSDGIAPIKFAKEIAVSAGLPFLVHLGAVQGHVSDDLAPQILNLMDRGDILAHVYTAKPGRVIEPGKSISAELRKAKERGVFFDMSHGWYNFGFETARYGIAEGVLPDIISSDLAVPNVFGPVYGLCETMSKMMALGLSLEEVVKMTTVNPARALHLSDRHGSLQTGRVADISVLESIQGRHLFTDSYGATLAGERLLRPVFTILSGKAVS